jgi:amino acid transporter
MGPYIGWINGWAIFVADVIVMASLSVIASTYTYLLFGWSGGANSTFWILVGSTVWIALMTWICWRGIELSARVQQILLAAEIAVLAAFAIVAIVKVYANAPTNSVRISADWFNPFALGFKPLVDGILLGIFIYWGWDSGVAVNEETESSAEAPGRAAVLSTLILLGIYLVVSAAAQSYGGTGLLVNNSNDVLRVLGTHVFGSPWDKLLIIAVLTSASASTQTTILPTARTTLSMARWKSIPGIFGHIHPKYLTPDVSTLGMGALSIVFTVVLVGFNSSQDVLGDSITALGFAILFYYGFTGLACAVYFRKELVKSWRHFIAAGVVPLAGFGLMAAIFVKAFHDYSQTGAGYAKPLFGIQIPIVIGIGSLLLGIPLMLLCALKFREFFSRKPELAAEGSLDYVPEEVSLHF